MADGGTRFDYSLIAERAWTEEGWVAPDSAVDPVPVEGRLEVAASPVGMSFSAGGVGGGPLVSMVTPEGDALSVDVQFDLPGPVLVDGRVEYLDVLPDIAGTVDVVMAPSADASSFSQVLRISAREALSDPRLAELVLPVEVSEGLEVVQEAGGGLTVREQVSGEVRFTAPVPQAWDSRGAASVDVGGEVSPLAAALGLGTAQSFDSFVSDDPLQDLDDVPGESVEDARVRAPQAGDEVMALDVALAGDGDDVALSGVAELADDPESVGPWFLDPQWGGTRQYVGYVQSGWPDTVHVNDAATDAALNVGFCDYGAPGMASCQKDSIARTYFQFSDLGNVGGVNPGDVKRAWVTVYGMHSYSCTPDWVSLLWTYGIGGNLTWNNQPGWIQELSARNDAHSAACGNQGDVEFDATAGAREVAAGNHSQLTMALVGGLELSANTWKRYQNVRFSVWVERTPLYPSEYYISQPERRECLTSGQGSFINTDTPTFAWRVTDLDGGDWGANLDVKNVNNRSVIIYDMREDSRVSSGVLFSHQIPRGPLQDGQTYVWESGGFDLWDASQKYGSMSACLFTVDLTPPVTPAVSSSVFPKDGWSSSSKGVFTFSANGSSDVVRYHYGWRTDTPIGSVDAATLGGSKSVELTPSGVGGKTLFVWAEDRAGWRSEPAQYVFNINFAAADGYWNMDTASGPVPDQTVAGGPALTVDEGIGRGQGATTTAGDLGLVFTSGTSTKSAFTAGPVLDTSKSFTVTAKVRVDNVTSRAGVAVSQDAERYAAFKIGQLPQVKCPPTPSTADDPALRMTTCLGMWAGPADAPQTAESGTEWAYAASPRTVTAGEWVYVAGTWDAATKTMSFQTCGTVGTIPDQKVQTAFGARTAWASSGPLRIGLGKSNYQLTEPWVGGIDEVKVYDGPIDQTEVRRSCRNPAPVS